MNNVYNQLVACSDDLRGINTADGWSGNAASAAAAVVNRIIDDVEEHAAEAAAARRAAGDVGDAITGVVHGVLDAEGIAAAGRFSIGSNGAIYDSGPPPDVPDDQKEAVAQERQQVAAELRDRVDEVIRQANDIDDDFCIVLDRILSGRTIDATSNNNENTSLAAAGNSGDALGSLSILSPPPEDASPTKNAAWWNSLSHNQQLRLIKDHPEFMGNRDGVAAWARSQANLAMVPREREKLLDERTQLMRSAPDDPRSGKELPDYIKDRLGQINDKLTALDKVDRMTIDLDGKPLPNRQLLSLDMTGDKAKVAIANGDVDNAKHVSVFTPGMNSAVEKNMEGYVKDMEGVQLTANEMLKDKSGQSVATVTWLGYEPPTTDVSDWGDVAAGGSAADGADKLAKFDQGINASRTSDPHLTALGHSFGSLTTGISLHNPDTGVDDAVFFGSPGVSNTPGQTGIDSGFPNEIKQLKIPEGHAYTLEADNDAIADVGNLTGRYGTDPGSMEGMGQLSTHDAIGYDGQRLAASSGHSEYTMVTPDGVDSTSKYNIAAIVAGRPELAIPAG